VRPITGRTAAAEDTLYLPGTSIELVCRIERPAPVRVALLDFDGTLSTIRAGWQTVMADGMVRDLLALGTGEPEEALRAETLAMIHRTTGISTAIQMDAFRAGVRQRGGEPPTTEACMARYLADLEQVIGARKCALAAGDRSPQDYMVPGARGLLEELHARHVALVLASGTDHEPLIEEAGLLGIAPYFSLGIFGALPPPALFTKDLLVDRLISDGLCRGEELLAIGDGPVEVAAARRVGGVAVGVAGDEMAPGRLDAAKRERLIAAGAHIIVPDLTQHAALLQYLLTEGATSPGGCHAIRDL
jgi:phosphoglycolate phosphatase-like HAD superfamily hydrolase